MIVPILEHLVFTIFFLPTMLSGDVHSTVSHTNVLTEKKSGAYMKESENAQICHYASMRESLERMRIEKEEELLIPALEGLDAMTTDLFCSSNPILICRNKHL